MVVRLSAECHSRSYATASSAFGSLAATKSSVRAAPGRRAPTLFPVLKRRGETPSSCANRACESPVDSRICDVRHRRDSSTLATAQFLQPAQNFFAYISLGLGHRLSLVSTNASTGYTAEPYGSSEVLARHTRTHPRSPSLAWAHRQVFPARCPDLRRKSVSRIAQARIATMKSIRAAFLITGLLVGLAACGGGDDAPAPPPSSPPPPPPAGTVIGANGRDGHRTQRHERGDSGRGTGRRHAHPHRADRDGRAALPAGVTAGGQMFAFTPHGTTFAVPVTMTIPFDPRRYQRPTPAFYKTNAQNQWQKIPNAVFGATSVSAQVTGFSIAGWLTEPLLSANPSTNGRSTS